MNPYTYDMNHALVNEKISRYQAEAASHRLARSAGPERAGVLDRLTNSIGQGLSSIATSVKVDRRPKRPAL